MNAALGAVWSLTSLVCQERQRLASAGGQGVLFVVPPGRGDAGGRPLRHRHSLKTQVRGR